ncbi:glutaredoxin domain-containing protein [Catellatospora citrea]|uniref:Membrane protein n=1 Tax=Catellatospora citrea TaxID=53366 RepID=A0A8J3KKE6_9ACTN|nr:glutaredoxin domain-containing protein [Catellatospora citrea]RKE11336.1 mycoredoxin [Catellatospora citrea]GIF96804.1 membrane protein [Catellatospora citrea]
MTRRWVPPILFVLIGFAVAARQVSTGSIGAGVALGLVFVLLAVALSPLVFPRSLAAADAQRRSAVDGKPIIYWRPGCQFCLRLRIRLGTAARRAHWVDIWRDPDGAAAVRAITGGDETVPTVVVAGQPHVNPDPGWLRGQLAR